eukprot:gb/GFBE01001015.1/.p1 GENE.gb/GFBE01001015.1/~~gb/GFBE01001015.1/.p1  ORF type:complete len:175 (+),score=27.41 gb/GFBE01001015.1/:1-525(+)
MDSFRHEQDGGVQGRGGYAQNVVERSDGSRGLLCALPPKSDQRRSHHKVRSRRLRPATAEEMQQLEEEIAAKAEERKEATSMQQEAAGSHSNSSFSDRVQEHISKMQRLRRHHGPALQWSREQERPRTDTVELSQLQFSVSDGSCDSASDSEGDGAGLEVTDLNFRALLLEPGR